MALSNSQYDEIIRGYDALQLKNSRIRQERLQEAYAKEPRLKELDDSIASCSVAQAHKYLDGQQSALMELKVQLANIRQERQSLLKGLGYPDNYFSDIYQ